MGENFGNICHDYLSDLYETYDQEQTDYYTLLYSQNTPYTDPALRFFPLTKENVNTVWDNYSIPDFDPEQMGQFDFPIMNQYNLVGLGPQDWFTTPDPNLNYPNHGLNALPYWYKYPIDPFYLQPNFLQNTNTTNSFEHYYQGSNFPNMFNSNSIHVIHRADNVQDAKRFWRDSQQINFQTNLPYERAFVDNNTYCQPGNDKLFKGQPRRDKSTYSCLQCYQGFLDRKTLNRHIETVHASLNLCIIAQCPFLCGCYRTGARANENMNTHIKTCRFKEEGLLLRPILTYYTLVDEKWIPNHTIVKHEPEIARDITWIPESMY